MQIAAPREHSSRRQNYQQQLRTQGGANNNNESSDIDGTAHRVASVTLESDSLSADQPMSFRSKRRKKIPRKEKHQEMDVDEQHRQGEHQQKQHSNEEGEMEEVGGRKIPACKVQMDWEQADHHPSTSAAKNRSPSDLENNQSQSDVLSELSESTSNADADDEQSDWPEFTDGKRSNRAHQLGHGNLLQPEPAPTGDAALSTAMVKQIERFLQDSGQKELLLDQIYRTSAIKQMLRKQGVSVQIVKKGRGTVALKKA